MSTHFEGLTCPSCKRVGVHDTEQETIDGIVYDVVTCTCGQELGYQEAYDQPQEQES